MLLWTHPTRYFKKNPNLSLAKRAQKLGVLSRKYWKAKGTSPYHAIKAPKRNDKQKKSVKTRLRGLYDQILTKRPGCILMDDETYQYADTGQTKGQEFYLAKTRLGVADHQKYKYPQ